MKNRLGLNDYKLLIVERRLINNKLKLLNNYFTFNDNLFSFDYLIKLHRFLFCDIYFEEIVSARDFDLIELYNIQSILDSIKEICSQNPVNIDDLLYKIDELWNLQPFYNGNTRTMMGYLAILNCEFLLDLDIDFDREIKSSCNAFKKENFVNQKRLTKKK